MLPMHQMMSSSSSSSSFRERGGRRGRQRSTAMTTIGRVIALGTCAWLVFGGGSGGGGSSDVVRSSAPVSMSRNNDAPRTSAVRKPRRPQGCESNTDATASATMSTTTEEEEARAEEASRVIERLRAEQASEEATTTSKGAIDDDMDAGEEIEVDGEEVVVIEDVAREDVSELSREEVKSPRDVSAPKDEDETLRRELEEIESAPHVALESPFAASSSSSVKTTALDPTRIRTISLNQPRAFLYEGFLTDDECDHILELSRGRLRKSGVVDAATGGSTVSDIRTSTGTFINRGQDDVIMEIEKRIERWSHVPRVNGEPLQVLRYEPGQEYRSHFDYFFHDGGKKNNRIATVLLYLSDVEEGGETVFPNTDAPANRNVSEYSACGAGGRAVKARKGDALLFWSMKPGGELDSGSSHAGCPVIKGEKWTATKWMHVNALGSKREDAHKIFYDGGPLENANCKDTREECRGWSESGECTKNPAFMHKECRMSCRLCQGGWRDGSYEKPPSASMVADSDETSQ